MFLRLRRYYGSIQVNYDSWRTLPASLYQLHPLVLPQVLHFMQVPLRTRVKLPHSPQLSPS